jgi:deoxyribonuclease V
VPIRPGPNAIAPEWPTDARQAVALQRRLVQHVRIAEPDAAGLPPRADALVAGVDASYGRFDRHCYAAVTLWDRAAGEVVEVATAVGRTPFPYVPGLLSFREGPIVLEALARLVATPDLLMFDAQGIAHPRGLGLAAHLGVLLDVPTVGCAKSRLFGSHDAVGPEPGDAVPLLAPARADRPAGSELIGFVLRNKRRCLPLYVSAGHRLGNRAAVDWVRACTTRYRLPEPTRLADHETKRLRRGVADAP